MSGQTVEDVRSFVMDYAPDVLVDDDDDKHLFDSYDEFLLNFRYPDDISPMKYCSVLLPDDGYADIAEYEFGHDKMVMLALTALHGVEDSHLHDMGDDEFYKKLADAGWREAEFRSAVDDGLVNIYEYEDDRQADHRREELMEDDPEW